MSNEGKYEGDNAQDPDDNYCVGDISLGSTGERITPILEEFHLRFSFIAHRSHPSFHLIIWVDKSLYHLLSDKIFCVEI